MKFAISVNMCRMDPSEDMRHILAQTLKLVQIAEQGGFEIAFAAEHHTIELTVAPNPFLQLTQWALNTSKIRLGTATIVAPYWHPIRLAGEAALFDLLSDGRLELGIARGAYQYEFDRLAGGIKQQAGMSYLKEILPAIRKLWAGDYAHDGDIWQFPTSTSVPKPLQKHLPVWVAARDPGTFDWAIKNGAHIMSTPLSKPALEIKVLSEKFEAAVADNPGIPRPRFLMLRAAYVYENAHQWRYPVDAAILEGRHFENLFQTNGAVRNGFTEPVDISSIANSDNYDPKLLHDNLLMGTPEEVIAKLHVYEEANVDLFCYGANLGLPWEDTIRSLELFIERVMPAFSGKSGDCSRMPAIEKAV